MNILLIYGGKSCEHDISIITACLAKGYFDGNIISAYLAQDNRCYLVPNDFTPKQHKNTKFKIQIAFLTGCRQIALVRGNRIRKIMDIDVAVNCCHGNCGEDGSVAGLCKLANLPMVGCGVAAAAVSMDKIYTKILLDAFKIPNIKGVYLTNKLLDGEMAKIEELGYPVIVKPATLGSSIGITLCHSRAELIQGLKTAFSYDSRVLCEKALVNFYELNCAAMRTADGVQISSVERPYSSHDILTFSDKYQRGEKFTAPVFAISDEERSKVQNLTRLVFEKLGLSGVVRIDYLVDSDTGEIYVNEVNSVPGSLSYGLWQSNYRLKQFGSELINQAIMEFDAAEHLKHTFESSVLDGKFAKK